MGFRKVRTIQVSEAVLLPVCDELDTYKGEYYVKIDGWLETFNNCREQGFCLHVETVDWGNENKTKDKFYIFACESRNSDEIMVICQTEYPGNKGMFGDNAYNNYVDKDHIDVEKEQFTFRTYFKYNEQQRASKFIVDTVKKFFKEEFKDK